jgi:hypothetical protein
MKEGGVGWWPFVSPRCLKAVSRRASLVEGSPALFPSAHQNGAFFKFYPHSMMNER